VEIEAGIHLDTGEVYARFQSLNPTNGLPPTDPTGQSIIGFLPPEPPHNPNDYPPVPGQGRGQGHVSYTVRAKTNLVTGTEIRNVAYITFDDTETIGTDWVDPHNAGAGINTNKQALVTIDADLPTSTIVGLPAVATNATFTVSWSGTDIGAGVSGYDVYVQTNYGPTNLWLANTPATSATFNGQNRSVYCFYTIARDGAGNVQTNYTFACTQTTNYPPRIDPVTNQFAVVGGQLVVTNSAYDPDGVTFSLDASAPAGATITTNGIFTWTPACAQGSSNYTVRVWATDLGTPPMSTNMTFDVTVPECIEASLGSTNLLAGQTSSVPVWLISTPVLTNMAFTVVYPPERFTTNFSLAVNAPQILATNVELLGAGLVRVSFTLPAASALGGPTNVGQLSFTAVSNQSSAFVSLLVTNVYGFKPDGTNLAKAYGPSGRVVVVGKEPLLEGALSTNRNLLLTLYGKPGSTYLISDKTSVLGTNWVAEWHLPMTNIAQTFQLDTTRPQVFYRAEEFFADPPLLELAGRSTNLVLLLYGRAGTNYVVRATTNVADPLSWISLTNFTLTNSFLFLDAGRPTNQAQFYRILRP
jgi:hypothetical protein